ncbi:metallopeptidase M24 family protein [Mycobacterium xenopi 4042]|uniref:Metallopeptidase M24 family protein n=1 Tax=Mycobacterium xenopi 4042 TaxID=1299334 RepID=X7ZJ82_MYCXE|nr:metallopeptidase M24 family protein [Mycobacterium xenopi 4042]
MSRELEALMLDHGADGVSFDTIVAAGANSAIPHHRPTDAVLATGDFVKIDSARWSRLPLGHDPHVRSRPGRRLATGDL